MTRKINFSLAAILVIWLLLLLPFKPVYADDTSVGQTTTQIVLDPLPVLVDTSTVTAQVVQNKIDAANSLLQSTANADSTSIIIIIQSNVPNTDTQTATNIATTQEPIASAVSDAGNKIQLAQQYIDSATMALQIAQSSISTVDSQTVIVATSQSELETATVAVSNNSNALQNAQNTLASAPLTTIDVTAPGLIATVYRAANGAAPAMPSANSVPIETIIVPQITYNWGSGQILNSDLSDHVIVQFTGKITLPADATKVKYAVYSDDGSKLYINNQLVINNWRDQGPSWSQYSPEFTITPGSTQDITLWYYENGGGAVATLGYMINNQYFTSPTSVNFSHVTSTTSQPDQTLIQAVNTAQQNLTISQQNLTSAQQNLTTAQQNLTNLQQIAQIDLQNANSLADSATVTVQDAIKAMNNAVQVTDRYYADLKAAEAKAAADKAAADAALAELLAQQAAEAQAIHDAQVAAQQAANAKAEADKKAAEDAAAKALADQQAADAAKAKAESDALAAQQAADLKAAQDKAYAEAKAIQDVANAKAEADKKAAEQAAADKAAADAKAAADKAAQDAANKAAEKAKAEVDKLAAQKAAEDKAKADAIGVKPNSPDQLSDTVAKEAPKEILVPHIQIDKIGIENGGIQFFGTKSAPQVVGENGQLTPPAPPPGSGLPIPAEAITTKDTFIGQPGGTTFNAPDIAVPIIETPLPATLAAVPGAAEINHAFVAMANIGNDMSPVTRKKAKKILVLTVAVAAIRRRFN